MQKNILLPPERHAQFMAYAEAHGLGPVAALEQLLHQAMESDNLYIPLPTYAVEAGLHQGKGCVLLGNKPRIKLTATEARNLYECLFAATTKSKFNSLFIPTDIGKHSVWLVRKGRGIKLTLDDTDHLLNVSLAVDLAREIQGAVGRASDLEHGQK